MGRSTRRPNVLVPLTLGGATEPKLAAVTQQAHAFDASVTLLHVLDGSETAGDAPRPAAVLEAESFLADVRDQLRRDGVRAHASVRYGPVPATVSQVAREQRASLIIVGASEPRRWQRRLVGGAGLAGAISRASRCPVLVVHRNPAPRVAEAA
jgi:nucleotide-binding universal stress UspA family protein